ncbi:MAG: WhiB family transcriptional regulator [Georgenia sp.]
MTTTETRETARAVLTEQLDRHTPAEVPCLTYPDAGWTDDDLEDQAYAARLCHACPALTACGDYITAWPEPTGAWAGTTERDRRPRQGRPRKETAA